MLLQIRDVKIIFMLYLEWFYSFGNLSRIIFSVVSVVLIYADDNFILRKVLHVLINVLHFFLKYK